MKRYLSMVIALTLSSFSAHANEAVFDNSGWYVGGSIGYISADVEPNTGIGSYSDSAVSNALYTGYNFNRYIGLEGGFMFTGDISNDDPSLDSAAAGGFMFGPKITLQISRVFAFYTKLGPVVLAHVEDYKNSSKDEETWSGTGAAISVGGQISIVRGMRVRISYDWTKASLEANDDNSITANYDIDMTLKQTSIGVYYQF